MEIEAKFAISGDLNPSAIDSLRLEGYSLRPGGVEDHRDTLLDTASRQITSRKYGLRIREIDSRLILTLKGPNNVTNGVHTRQEWEAPLPIMTLDPDAWPEPIANLTRELIGGKQLAPILHVVVQRRLWGVKRGARIVGELALDSGVILAAGRREPIHELELELKSNGSATDLATLTEQLRANLPLTPEPRSKLQRGLALLRHARWTMDSSTSIVSLVRHYVHQKRRSALAALHDVMRVGDADSIHDMRVAIRRIRSVLLEIEDIPIFARREARALRKRLRVFATQLGAVRDLDIIAAGIKRYDASGASHVLDNVESQRKRAYNTLIDSLESDRFSKIMNRLNRCEIARKTVDDTSACPTARQYIGGILWSRYDAMLRHEDAIDLGVSSEMHQARIMAKRLRYILEVFSPAYRQEIVKPFRQAVIDFQEAFGALQDLTVIQQTLLDMSVVDSTSDNHGRLARSLAAEHTHALAAARESWRTLASNDMRATLAQVVASV